MADKHVDEGKGRIKEAAGSLTNDRSLERGQTRPGQGNTQGQGRQGRRHAQRTRQSNRQPSAQATTTNAWEVTCSPS